MNDSLTKSWCSGSSPRACSCAIRARGPGAARRAVEPARVDRHRVAGVPRVGVRGEELHVLAAADAGGLTGCTRRIVLVDRPHDGQARGAGSRPCAPGRTAARRRRDRPWRRSCRRTPCRNGPRPAPAPPPSRPVPGAKASHVAQRDPFGHARRAPPPVPRPGPAGVSRRTIVSGSVTSTMPVSTSTVATPMVPCPHIGKKPLTSMYSTPKSASGRVGGWRIAPLIAACPRGSSTRKRRNSSRCSMAYWRRSAMVAPGIGATPPVTTRVGMPSVCESTALSARTERIRRPVRSARCQHGWLGRLGPWMPPPGRGARGPAGRAAGGTGRRTGRPSPYRA